MDPLNATECVDRVQKLRDELLLTYDARVVFSAMLAATVGVSAALRVAQVYNVETVAILYAKTLSESLLHKPAKVHVNYQNEDDAKKQSQEKAN